MQGEGYWTKLHRERLSRRRVLGGAALGGAGLAGLALAGCGGDDEGGATATATGAVKEETPRKGGTFTWATSPPVGFDPHFNDSSQTHQILSLFHAHLTRYSLGPKFKVNDFTVQTDLAESWEQASDTTFIFKLRPGLKWQDKPPVNGRELTAQDVVYTFDRIKKQPATFAAFYFAFLDRWEATDARTVRLTLKEPFAPFMNYLSGNFTWIVPREAVEKFGDLKGVDAAIGAGPWMVQSFNPGTGITLVRNPNYYRTDVPYIDTLSARFGLAPAAVDAAFRSGEMQLAGALAAGLAPVSRYEQLKKDVRDTETLEWDRPSGTHMFMRTDKPPFNDERVRHALALSINQDEFIKAVFGGYGYNQPCVFRGLEGSLEINQLGPGADAYTYDPKKARELLAAAGHPNGLTVPIVVGNVSAEHVENLELIQSQMAEGGFKADIQVQEYAAFMGGAYRGRYDVMAYHYYRIYSDGDQVFDMFHTKGDINQNHVNDPELDRMIEKQRRTMNKEERNKVLGDIQKYVAGKYYDIFLPYNKQLSLWRKSLRGFRPSGWYDQGAVLLNAWLAQ